MSYLPVWNEIRIGLTTLREELSVDHLEGLLPDDTGGALGLESPVDPLDLVLSETGRLAQRLQTVRPVTRRCF